MRAHEMIPSRRAVCAALLLSLPAVPALAQLPNASAAAFGMGGNFTAMARGYEAVAWNPANLAMPGRPFFSLGLGIIGGSAGLDPIDARTLHRFSGLLIDSATKVSWIEQARLSGGQRARVDGGATPIGFSFGPVGVQVGSSMYTNMNLSPDAWEAMLFGNAGNNNGQPKAIDLTGTRVRAAAFTTGAVSLALPLPFRFTAGILSNERMALGITGKYVTGNGLVVAEDIGSAFGANDLLLRFPVIAPDSMYDGIVGSGQAADVGFAWSAGPWKVGLMAENVFSTFAWDTTKLVYRPGTGTVNSSTGDVDFDQQPWAAAPAALREAVTAQAFKPAVRVGMAWRMGRSLTLSADMKTQAAGDAAIVIGPASHLGVGAEWRLLPFLPLRGGVAAVSDGWQAGVGAGLRLLGYELGAATSIRRRGDATESGLMIGVVGIGR